MALAKAADKIEELGELKAKYQEKARGLQKRLQSAETDLARQRDAAEKLGKEARDLRRHLKFKDRELLRVGHERREERERLRTELHLQVENNKAILEKVRRMRRKSGLTRARKADAAARERAFGGLFAGQRRRSRPSTVFWLSVDARGVRKGRLAEGQGVQVLAARLELALLPRQNRFQLRNDFLVAAFEAVNVFLVSAP